MPHCLIFMSLSISETLLPGAMSCADHISRLISKARMNQFRRRPRILRSLVLLGAAFILLTDLAGDSFAHRLRHRRSPTVDACLPPDVRASETAVYGFNGKKNVTVAGRVKELEGRCRNGQLVGPDKKQIRFFRISCWGYPPPNYQEIRAEEERTLKALKAKYTVIVINCDPRIP